MRQFDLAFGMRVRLRHETEDCQNSRGPPSASTPTSGCEPQPYINEVRALLRHSTYSKEEARREMETAR